MIVNGDSTELNNNVRYRREDSGKNSYLKDIHLEIFKGMYKAITALLIGTWCYGYGQVFNDISRPVNLLYNGVDSVRLMAGIGAFDFDADGDDDLVLIGGKSSVKLYRNAGDFDFEDVTIGSGLDQVNHQVAVVAAADFNNDGAQDLLMTTVENQPNLIYQNNGDGTFTDMTEPSGIGKNRYWGMAITLGDFNNDSFLDIYIGNYAMERIRHILPVPPAPNELFLSQGRAFDYSEQAARMGVRGNGYTLAAKFMDFDNDRDLDLYVANDFGAGGMEPNQYYENIEGQLIERGRAYGLDVSAFSMGIGYGDYDNDQDFDIYISDIGRNPFLENSDTKFQPLSLNTYMDGMHTSWGGEFVDIHNDGLLDLVMTNGGVLDDQLEEPCVYHENLGGAFEEHEIFQANYPYYARGLCVADFDNDGDQDLMINTVTEDEANPPSRIAVQQNLSDILYRKNNFLKVRLEGVSGNRDALGAVLKVTLSNNSVQMRTLGVGGAYLSAQSKTVHFGLGEQSIRSLSISWPNGEEQILENLPHNTFIKVIEGQTFTIIEPNITTATRGSGSTAIRIQNPVREEAKIWFVGREQFDPEIRIRLLSIDGRELDNIRITGASRNYVSIPTRGIPAGLYLLQFNWKGEILTKRLVIAR